MARSFLPEEAASLIASFSRTQQQFGAQSSQREVLAKNAALQEELLWRIDVIAPAIVGQLSGAKPEACANNQHILEYIRRLVQFHLFESTYHQSIQTRDQLQPQITRDLNLLQQGTKKGLAWMLLPNDRKEQATRAYTDLKQNAGPAYQQALARLTKALKEAELVSTTQASNLFFADCIAYAPDYRLILAKTTKHEIPQIKSLMNDHISIINALKQIGSSYDDQKKKLAAAIDRYLIAQAEEQLKTVSVDEFRQLKAGIRVQLLHDAGLHSMSDVIHATTSQLESINGISWAMASTIKTEAQEYINGFKSSVKVRLNPDSKTQNASLLLKYTYAYKEVWDAWRLVSDHYDHNASKIEKSIQSLQAVASELDWLFVPAPQKTNAKSAYQYLSSLLTSEYLSTSRDAVSRCRHVSSVTIDEIWDDFTKNPIPYYTILEDIAPGCTGNDAQGYYGLPEDLAKAVEDQCFFPDGLKVELRKYQEWGVKYILHQERVLLGDEMGLGKTVQAIATMVSLRNTGATHFIVVCPASVLANWCRQIAKFSKLRVVKVHGSDRDRGLHEWLNDGGVAVTTYETTAHFNVPANAKVDMVVVDEAHYIKNPDAMRTRNTKKLCSLADRLLFMTGTPIENKVDEMIKLIQMLQPDIARLIENKTVIAKSNDFRNMIVPVYYRRKREDVLKELPELIVEEEWCTLSAEEKRIYEYTLNCGTYPEVRRVSWNIDDVHKASKAKRLLEIIDDAKADNRKVLIFSFFIDTIRKIKSLLGDACMPPITGSVQAAERQRIIDQFEQREPGACLVAQIQAGGTGLNIQAASVVVLCEPQFKPSIENQAISRAYRMGQARNVLVYRLLAQDSIDERLMELIAEKQRIFDAFADKSVAAEAQKDFEVDTRTFGQLIKEEIERINREKGLADTTNDADTSDETEQPVVSQPETIVVQTRIDEPLPQTPAPIREVIQEPAPVVPHAMESNRRPARQSQTPMNAKQPEREPVANPMKELIDTLQEVQVNLRQATKYYDSLVFEGTVVHHDSFGDGMVTKRQGNAFYVQFFDHKEERVFALPYAFTNGYIQAMTPDFPEKNAKYAPVINQANRGTKQADTAQTGLSQDKHITDASIEVPIMPPDTGDVQNTPEHDDPLLSELHENGFEYVDHRKTTGLLLIKYDSQKIGKFIAIRTKYGLRSNVEQHVAAISGGRAWCINEQIV